jgi:hypothetical protein
MRQILAFILALGASFLVTWAGLHYDNALAYIGIGLIALVLILFGHSWAFPKAAPIQYVQGPPETAPTNEAGRALQALRRARDSAQIAIHNRSEAQAERANHEIKAAIISAQKQFGIPGMKISGADSQRHLASICVKFIDSFYPLLREGHISDAIKAAKKFLDEWRPASTRLDNHPSQDSSSALAEGR